jgi:hypothetical protein
VEFVVLGSGSGRSLRVFLFLHPQLQQSIPHPARGWIRGTNEGKDEYEGSVTASYRVTVPQWKEMVSQVSVSAG